MSTNITRTLKVAATSLVLSLAFASQASAGILCDWFGICLGGGGGGGEPASAPEIDGAGAPLVIALVASIALIIFRRVRR